MLRKTTFGRRVLATGGNETAARYSGIDTNSIKLGVLMISGVTAAIAGMLYAGRLETGRYQFGQDDELRSSLRRCSAATACSAVLARSRARSSAR